MITGAIFDFDGTLFDSMQIWQTIPADYLVSIGYKPKEDINRVFQNLCLEDSALYYQREYGVTLSTEEIINGITSMVAHYYKDIIQPKANIEGLLKLLENKGVKMCIATANDESLIKAALMRCGIDGYFSKIITCSQVGEGKDKPSIFYEALKELETKKESTLVFEDALYALETAKNAGFTVVGVYDETEEEEERLKELSTFYFKDFSVLDDFLKFASAFC